MRLDSKTDFFKMMRLATFALLAAVAHAGDKTCNDEAFLQPDMVPINEQFMRMDDATLARHGGHKKVHVKGAVWLRVAFDRDTVRSDAEFKLEIQSLYDGHVQHLNATTLAQWQYSSAYFNGDSVEIRFKGDKASEPSVVGAIADAPSSVSTICGPTDDRTSSSAARAARYLGSGGCSGWMIRDANHCFLTAGHCGRNAQGSGTMQFNVPLSHPNGSMINPPPEDQYAVDPASVIFDNSGVGRDWMYLGTFPNSNTGLTAWEAQQDAYALTTEVPEIGTYVQKYGYGTTSPRNQYSQSQQFHGLPDAYAGSGGNPNAARYTIDTTGGDSGSAVESQEGLAFAVHTHGGCMPDGSGSNAGTLLLNEDLQAALANPQGICASKK